MDPVVVVIQKEQNNDRQCFAKPDPFQALPGQQVAFLFPGEPRARIRFVGNSPFSETEFALRPSPDSGESGLGIKQVKQLTNDESFTYQVEWPNGGGGKGGGEVLPSRQIL